MLIIFAINSSLYHDTQRDTHPKAGSANDDIAFYQHTYLIIYDLYTIFIEIFEKRDPNDIWYINIFVKPGPRNLKIENPTPDSYKRIVIQQATAFQTQHLPWIALNDFVATTVRSAAMLAPLSVRPSSSQLDRDKKAAKIKNQLKTVKKSIERLGVGGSHTRKKHRMKYRMNNTKRRFTKEKLCMTRKRART
jgi:hypothetical protein